MDSPIARMYRGAMEALASAGTPFLVGGAFAMQPYTGLSRDTKDFDLFVRESDLQRALETLEAAGYATDLTYPHWLAKASIGDDFIDIIFNSGNGVARVDDEWFEHAPKAAVMGMTVLLCPPEETLWAKAFIMERERYDGADVAHLLRTVGRDLDWPRLVRRFGPHWRVLLSHLTLFGFIYPAERDIIPEWVMFDLIRRLLVEMETNPEPELVCRGTLLSRAQYSQDVSEWGYQDARTVADGTMTPEQASRWTAAAPEKQDET